MKSTILPLICFLLAFNSCKSKSEQQLEQQADEQEARIEAKDKDLQNIRGGLNELMEKLEVAAKQEAYLQDIDFSNTNSMNEALDNIEKALDASLQQIAVYKATESQEVNQLKVSLAEVESQLKQREIEIENYKNLLERGTDGTPVPPPTGPDYDLLVNSLKSDLRNTKMKLGKALEKNTEVVRENTTLKADIAGLESQKAALTNAIAKAEKELANLERQKEEANRKFELEITALKEKLEKEKAMIYVNIARSMAKEVNNVKKAKGKRDEYCQKVVFFYEKVLECNCAVATKIKTEYENFKKNCG